MKQLKNYAPAIGWGIFIFIISVIPGKDIPVIESPWDLIKMDKLVHMLIYGIFMALILRGWTQSPKNEGSIQGMGYWIKAAIMCSLYGLFLEWFQDKYCQDRAYEFYDALANAIGSFSAVAIFYCMKRIK